MALILIENIPKISKKKTLSRFRFRMEPDIANNLSFLAVVALENYWLSLAQFH